MAGTSSEQLRENVVRAALPLIAEYESLTMAQIARAAGIGEADLLAVFADKDAVIEACAATVAARVEAAIDPSEEVRKMDAILMEQPLASRLVDVLGILDAYYRRVRADLEAFQRASAPRTGTASSPGTQSFSQEDSRALGRLPEIRQAVSRLLEPDAQHLRLPAEALAEAFLGMSLGAARTPRPDQSPLPAEHVVDLFLHGALITGHRG